MTVELWPPLRAATRGLGCDGRALNQHSFVLHLATGQLRDVGVAPNAAHSVILGGWAPHDVLLFWSGPGASILADGTRLRGLDFVHGGRLIAYGTGLVVPSPEALARCGSREIAVIGSGRLYPTIANKTAGVGRCGGRF